MTAKQMFTREQVERIINLVNNDKKPPSWFVAECIDAVIFVDAGQQEKCKSPCGSCKCGKKE